MKINTFSRLLACLLAFVLAFGTFTTAVAESYSLDELTNTLYTYLLDARMKAFFTELLGKGTAVEAAQMYQFLTPENTDAIGEKLNELLTEEDWANLDAHMASLFENLSNEDFREVLRTLGLNEEDYIITPPVNYTAVAPFAQGPVKPTGIALTTKARAAGTETRTGEGTNDDVEYDNTTNNGLEMGKGVTPNEDGSYTITLENYTTGTVVTTETTVPTDIVLVLDESGSMNSKMQKYVETYWNSVYEFYSRDYYILYEGSYYAVEKQGSGQGKPYHTGVDLGGVILGTQDLYPKTDENDNAQNHVQFYEQKDTYTREVALRNAVNSFVESVYEKAKNEENPVDHRIAVVTFSSGSTIECELQSVASNKDTIIAAINGMSPSGQTDIKDGAADAVSIFKAAESQGDGTVARNRVVVFFTDGKPGIGEDWSSMTTEDHADPAIASAYTLKNQYKVTSYTVAVIDGADPNASIADAIPDPNSSQCNDSAVQVSTKNLFLHHMSSNYPQATSMSNGGAGSNKGYYLTASTPEALNAIFEKIATNINTPTISLGKESIVKDYVAPSFDFPRDASGNILSDDVKVTVHRVKCLGYADGKPQWAETANWEDITNQVSVELVDRAENGNGMVSVEVTGFDFNANFVSDKDKSTNGSGDYGSKLVISFDVVEREGFLGGNHVETNGSGSGIYVPNFGSDAVDKYPRPDTDVDTDQPVFEDKIGNPTADAPNFNVYLHGDDLTIDRIKQDVLVEIEGYTLNLAAGAAGYWGLEKWQTEYVNIEVKFTTDEAGKVELTDETLIDLGANGEFQRDYFVHVTISPKDSTGTATTKTAYAHGVINVFRPVVTFQDATVDYRSPINDKGYQSNHVDMTYSKNNFVTATWGGLVPVNNGAPFIGDAPVLTYQYDYADGVTAGIVTAQDVVPMNVTVYANGVEVAAKDVTYQHDCKVTLPEGVACSFQRPNRDSKLAFCLHVINTTSSLTITKEGMADGEKAMINVTVTKEDVGFNKTFTLMVGNETVTIKELPVGATFTVSEDTSWTWRYAAPVITESTGTIQADGTEVTITNNKNNDRWLSDESSITNVFGADGITQQPNNN